MRTYVKLFKDGDHMAIETNANTEDDFHDAFVARLSELVEDGRYSSDWEFQLDRWLRNYVEICCKLRGYKAEVIERRVISCGWDEAPSSAEVLVEKAAAE